MSGATANVGQRTYLYSDAQGKPRKKITDAETKLIKEAIESNEALKKKVEMNPKLKVYVTLLSSDSLYITVGKVKFFVSRKKSVEAVHSTDFLIIEESFCRGSRIESIKDFFRSVFLFFCPSRGVTLKQGYQQFRKALQAGQTWISASEKTELTAQVNRLIDSAKDIEHALYSAHPKKSLEGLAGCYADKILAREETLIPVGYKKQDGSLQPVLLHFYKREETCVLEVFVDDPDLGAKMHPTQVREWNKAPTREEITELLQIFFARLVPESADVLKRESRPSTFFANVYENLREKKLAELGKKTETPPRGAKLSEEVMKGSYSTFSSLIASIDEMNKGKWTTGLSQETIRPTHSASERVSTWIEHLSGNTPLSADQKCSLLYSLAASWANDYLKNAASLPPSKRIEAYQDVLEIIHHLTRKIAKLTPNGPEEVILPEKIASLKKKCKEMIDALHQKEEMGVRKKRELFKVERQSSETSIPIVVPTHTAQQEVALDKDLFDDENRFRELLSGLDGIPAGALGIRDTLIQAMKGRFVGLSAHEIKGEVEKLVEAVVDDNFFAALRGAYGKLLLDIDKATFIEELLFSIFYPHLISVNIKKKEDFRKDRGAVAKLLRRIVDESVLPSAKKEMVALRELLLLKTLIPTEASLELEKEFLREKGLSEAVLRTIPALAPRTYLPISLTHSIGLLATECNALIEKASETQNVMQKKALLERAQSHALEVLKKMPPPGPQRELGGVSLWDGLSPEERKSALESIATLEHVVWETQMKLSKNTSSGVLRFLLIKGQAVQIELLHQEESYKPYTLDMPLYNQLLSQDLSAQLSQDPRLERDLMCVYDFLLSNEPKNEKEPLRDEITRDTSKVVRIRESYLENQQLKVLQEEWLYYQTISDPDYTVYGINETTRTEGVSFFDGNPDLLLNQTSLTIIGTEKGFHIEGGDKKTVAVLFPNGPEEAAIPKRVPFLPTMISGVQRELMREEKNLLDDIRTPATVEAWSAQIGACMEQGSQFLPPDLLQALLDIRKEPEDSNNRYALSSYTASTALQALNLLSTPNFCLYLQNERVQRFIEESIFGSFLFQQAFLANPVSLLACLERLETQIALAEKKYPEAKLFLESIVVRLTPLAQAVVESIKKEGVGSEMIDYAPLWRNKSAGALHDAYFNTTDQKTVTDGEGDPLRAMQCLLAKLEEMEEVIAQLEKLDPKGPVPHYFSGAVGERAVDKLPMEKRSQVYLRTLEYFQHTKFSEKDLDIILESIHFVDKDTLHSEVYTSIMSWFQGQIVPLIEKNEDILTRVLTTILTVEKTPVVGRGTWTRISSVPLIYQFDSAGKKVICNISTMEITGEKEKKAVLKFIPDSLLALPLLQKALKTKKVLAEEKREGNKVSYSWAHENQVFCLTNSGGTKITLTRTEDKITYTFQEVNVESPKGAADELLQNNGFWTGSNGSNVVFSDGMNAPSAHSKYTVPIEKNAISRVNVGNLSVSNAPLSLSPFPSVHASALITLLEEGIPKEIRVKGSSLRFYREETRWDCSLAGKRVGTYREVTSEEEKQRLDVKFGKNWNEFVIPILEENKEAYILIPYAQASEDQKVVADQKSGLPVAPEIIRFKEDGSLEISTEGGVYLAQKLLLEAENSDDVLLKEKYYAEAHALLKKMNLSHAPEDAEKKERMARVFAMLRKTSPLSPSRLPSFKACAIGLRLFLTMQRLEREGRLPLSEQERWVESERAVTLFRSYLTVSEKTSLLKEIFALTSAEKMQLEKVEKLLLQKAFSNPELFLERAGAVKGEITIPFPNRVDPQFVLTLLRTAKPDLAFDIKKVQSPVTLDFILKNFWNILIAINKNKLAPDSPLLLFLGQGAEKALSQTPEESHRYALLDQQARQFLLTFAYQQNAFNDGMKDGNESLSEMKKTFGGLKEDFFEFCGCANECVMMQSEVAEIPKLPETLQQLTPQAIGLTAGGVEKALEKIRSFKEKIDQVLKEVEAFTKPFKEKFHVLTRAIKELEKAKKNIKEELEELKESLEQEGCDKDALKAQIQSKKETIERIESSLQQKNEEIQNFLSQPAGEDPITKKPIAVFQIANGSYEEMFAELKTVSEELEEKITKLAQAVLEVRKLKELKENWDRLVAGIEKARSVASAPIDLPEFDEEETRQIMSIMESVEVREGRIEFEDVRKLVRSSRGLLRAMALGLKAYELSGLVARKEAISDVAGPLEILVGISALTKERTFVIGERRPMEAPLSFADIRRNSLAKNVFTLEELDCIENGLVKLDAKKQKNMLLELSKMIKQSQSHFVAQTELGTNIARIQECYDQLMSARGRPLVTSPEVPKGNQVSNYEQFCERAPGLTQEEKDAITKNKERLSACLTYENPDFSWMKKEFPALRRFIDSIEKMRITENGDVIVLKFANFLAKDDSEEFFVEYASTKARVESIELIKSLEEAVPPEKVSFTEGLLTGLSTLRTKPPFPFSPVLSPTQLDNAEAQLVTDIANLTGRIKVKKELVLEEIKKRALSSLPLEVREVRQRNGSDGELLQSVYRAHRKGGFASAKTDPSTSLDAHISACEILEMQMTMLLKAKKSLSDLRSLEKKSVVIGSSRLRYEAQVGRGIEAQWMKRSAQFLDYVERCQRTKELSEVRESLKPHLRKIYYLQSRLGIVLRKDQLDALADIIEQPSLLKQLRMGLGKTSVLLPFALEILGSQGYMPIGIVPKALFKMNYDEMDATTRSVFELAGTFFPFSREDISLPLTIESLDQLSKKCVDFFDALSHGEYVLTTIESKGSLDNKIVELEQSMAVLNERLEETSNKKAILRLIAEHERALGMLYRVKDAFECDQARLIIDEADQVARANYSINAEMGAKVAPEQILRDTVSSVFELITQDETCREIKELFEENRHLDISENKLLVDEKLRTIARAYLKNKITLPQDFNDEDRKWIEEWLVGGKLSLSSEKKQQIADLMPILNALRKMLNSSLRSCMGRKIGLGADFDPVHKAVGVPASQGITSKTQKFSDPLMQLTLTSMIALYKPQGEAFLRENATYVLEKLENKVRRTPAEEAAKNKLENLLGKVKEGEKVSFHNSLSGKDPWQIVVRLLYVDRVIDQKLISISEQQIVRPAQDALRGCHVVGLTGTATTNLSHLIAEEGMKNIVEGGREVTAEVEYRLASASPEKLNTPVKWYGDSSQALLQFKELAKKGSGISFIVNQAGACDAYSLEEIVKALGDSGGRPIVYFSIEKEKKSVRIDGQVKPLDDLSDEEKSRVEEQGFFYYHTPHVRGTHFDIPIGSKGVLLLSPSVNANDRDQAAYRARSLGEGHSLEVWISQTQYDEFRKAGRAPTLKDVFLASHQQSIVDEQREDLAAYRLHINGMLMHAADVTKKRVQLASPFPVRGEEVDERVGEEVSLAKASVHALLQSFFLQGGGNDAYLRGLEREQFLGGEVSTQKHLLGLIDVQIRRGSMLIDKLMEEKKQHSPPYDAVFDKAIEELNKALEQLKQEKEKISDMWDKAIAKYLPEKCPAVPMEEGIAETEAESEEEQEVTSEVSAKASGEATSLGVGAIFASIDTTLLDSVYSNATRPLGDYPSILPGKGGLVGVSPLWRNIGISPLLARKFKNSFKGVIPNVRVLILKKTERIDNPYLFSLVDAEEAFQITSERTAIFEEGERESDGRPIYVGSTVVVETMPDGKISLRAEGIVPGASVECLNHLQDSSIRAQVLLSCLCSGIITFSNEDWICVENYWQKVDRKDQEALKKMLRETFEKTNPKLLKEIFSHMT